MMNYGMNPMFGTDIMASGMMNPMMMGGFYNPATQINYMNQMDQYAIDRQVKLYKNQNNAQFQMSAQTDGISKQVQILAEKAQGNKQNAVQAAYNKLVASVKDSYGAQLQGTAEEKEAQARAYAERIYAQQTGSLLTDEIRANAGGSFIEGFKQVVTLGLGNRRTSEENVAKINGTAVSTGESAKKYLGYAAGGATLALGGTMLYKYSNPILKGLGAIAKFLFTKAA